MTSAVEASLTQLAGDLSQVGVQWSLIGGIAVSARAEPRFTRDVDVCILVDTDEDAERIAGSLLARGYAVVTVVEHEYQQRLATIRLQSPLHGGVLVDLLFASTGLEQEAVESAEPLEVLPAVVLPVARAPHLAVMKLLSRDDTTRPQDAMDLRALRRVLTADEASEVRALAALVMARGYNRGRDLVALAEDYLSDS